MAKKRKRGSLETTPISGSFCLVRPTYFFPMRSNWAAIYAVLEPVFRGRLPDKPRGYPPPTLDGAVRELFHRRHQQLLRLRELGWEAARSKMRTYCPPSLARYPGLGKRKDGSRPTLLRCSLKSWCPFCWARQVGDIYDRVEETLFPADREPRRLGLLEVIGQRDIPQDQTSIQAVVRAIGKNRRAFFAAVPQPIGLLQLSTIEPFEDSWRVLTRQLALVPENFDSACLPGVADGLRLVHHVPPLRKNQLPRIVGRVVAYPQRLLTGSVGAVRQIQEARERARLLSTFGLFRRSLLGGY